MYDSNKLYNLLGNGLIYFGATLVLAGIGVFGIENYQYSEAKSALENSTFVEENNRIEKLSELEQERINNNNNNNNNEFPNLPTTLGITGGLTSLIGFGFVAKGLKKKKLQ